MNLPNDSQTYLWLAQLLLIDQDFKYNISSFLCTYVYKNHLKIKYVRREILSPLKAQHIRIKAGKQILYIKRHENFNYHIQLIKKLKENALKVL
jgi:hypothetical protein